jgi:uncharacterized coiled-coil protein SlyX
MFELVQEALCIAQQSVEKLEHLSATYEGTINDAEGTLAAKETEVSELRRMLAQERGVVDKQESEMQALQERVTDADEKATSLENQMEALQVCPTRWLSCSNQIWLKGSGQCAEKIFVRTKSQCSRA